MELTPVNPDGTAQESNMVFKVIMVGGPKVGKSNLMYKLVYNSFDLSSVLNVGVEFGCLVVPYKNKYYKMQLWDTEGFTKISATYEGFHKNAIGAFLVIDLTRKESIDEAKRIMHDLTHKSQNEMIIVVLANKSDLKNLREVSQNDLDFIKLAHNLKWFDVSAWTGQGLKDAMRQMVAEIITLIDSL